MNRINSGNMLQFYPHRAQLTNIEMVFSDSRQELGQLVGVAAG